MLVGNIENTSFFQESFPESQLNTFENQKIKINLFVAASILFWKILRTICENL